MADAESFGVVSDQLLSWQRWPAQFFGHRQARRLMAPMIASSHDICGSVDFKGIAMLNFVCIVRPTQELSKALYQIGLNGRLDVSLVRAFWTMVSFHARCSLEGDPLSQHFRWCCNCMKLVKWLLNQRENKSLVESGFSLKRAIEAPGLDVLPPAPRCQLSKLHIHYICQQ